MKKRAISKVVMGKMKVVITPEEMERMRKSREKSHKELMKMLKKRAKYV